MAKGETVAMLPREALIAVLPPMIEVRKSQREGARYPLYLSWRFGPLPMNTPDAQELILENAIFNGAPVPVVAPEPPDELPGIDAGDQLEDTGENPEKTGAGLAGWVRGLGNFG